MESLGFHQREKKSSQFSLIYGLRGEMRFVEREDEICWNGRCDIWLVSFLLRSKI